MSVVLWWPFANANRATGLRSRPSKRAGRGWLTTRYFRGKQSVFLAATARPTTIRHIEQTFESLVKEITA